MPLQLKQHIQLQGDNPLDAIVDGNTHVKACFVALVVMQYGVEVAVERYKPFNLSTASVHASLVFYYDNEALICKAYAKFMRQMREIETYSSREEIMCRQQKSD